MKIEMEWISVEDGLPKTDAPVLVNMECFFTDKKCVMTAIYTYWSTKKWLIYPKDIVTHWMPFPEPIKTEK